MIRSNLKRMLRRLYLVLGVLLLVSLVAKFRGAIPGIAGTGLDRALGDAYEYLRDMSLLIATGGVAYLTNIFQRRSNFVESLEKEWRGIVATKSALYAFCEKPFPTTDDYLAAFCRISETIDNMRIVYRNVGETDDLIGLYPYAPLHDMRRALQSIDPRKRPEIPAEERKLARDAMLQSFYALRETFLEELDLAEPGHPLLVSSARRLKVPGATSSARGRQDRQAGVQGRSTAPRPDVDALLRRLYEAEQASLGQPARPSRIAGG